MAKLSAINGIDAAFVQQLATNGVETSDQLLQRGATSEQRAALVAATAVDPVLLIVWVCRVDLERIKGVAWDYARLLTGSGVTTVPDLGTRTANELHPQIAATNRANKLVRRAPTLVQVRDWIEQARELPALVTLDANEAERIAAYGVDGGAAATSATATATATTLVTTTLVDVTVLDVSDAGDSIPTSGNGETRYAISNGADDVEARTSATETSPQLIDMAYGVDGEDDTGATGAVDMSYNNDSIRASGEATDHTITSEEAAPALSDHTEANRYSSGVDTVSGTIVADYIPEAATNVDNYDSGADTVSGTMVASYTDETANAASAAYDAVGDEQAGIEGLDEVVVARLAERGITTHEQLLQRGASWEGRAALAYEAGISQIPLMEWLHRADLRRVAGIDASSADLLASAGVGSVPDLAYRNPDELLAVLWTVYQRRGGATQPPSKETLGSWIAQAHNIAPLLSFPPTEVY